ncbi:MAG: phosphatidate cytidylyltransferase [Alistipes sp.]|nr:phosphatidate cytidylyltransferase [Alistipes sp.]
MENKKLKELAVRTASGVVMLLLFIGALVWSKWSAGALFAVILIGGLLEFYRLCRKKGVQPMSSVGVATSLAIFALAFAVFLQWGSPATETTARVVLGALLYTMLIVPTTFVCELWRKSATPIANIATTFMGIIYVALPMAMLLYIPQMLVGKWSAWAMLAFVSIIWINDICAYLVGVSIGKHRLCERISPKKSWEGFFGGLIGAVGFAVLFGHLFGGNLVVWGGLGLVAALAGVAGDLIESLIKREVDVKDSGSMMPGHGGFLDRFDALFLATPFALFYLIVMSLS